MNRRITLIGFVLVGLLVACQEAVSTPPPPLTAVSQLLPTPTIAAAVPEPTLPPPPTVAPPATPTTEPIVVEPTAVVETNRDGINLLTPADFGNNRNPLTGEEVDPANLQRRPLAVKLSNSPPYWTRPQAGLNDADLIFEHTTESNITRFTAIFYGKNPPQVGPIRSARLIDLELPAMYDAGFAFSGASAGVGQRLASTDFRPRIVYSTEPGYFRTGEDKPFEHTLYGRLERFRQVLEGRGQNIPPTFSAINTFSSLPPAGGQPATNIQLDYDWTKIDWQYDAEIGRYRRWADGVEHQDGNTGEQVTVSNIIVLFPAHVEDVNICEEIRDGVCAHLSVQIQLWGQGSAVVFRDGQRYDVIWKRINRTDSLIFSDLNGNPFPLQIGNSWVQIMPTWLENPLVVE